MTAYTRRQFLESAALVAAAPALAFASVCAQLAALFVERQAVT